ncbi:MULTISPECIES: EAL domain-containing protein [unclassified Synechocystis]|uniref:EAL domain-containing response regulator n=1 Tax=unclassified Synechocystis TaxID=2640012 RepID=UPI0003F9C3E0|nr:MULTISPECIES: EAL domain-containing protein [unclassified Synechocystis]AIE73612.1 Two-component response regulator [Synechocystis sp. PCC 6714]MCT0254974.1 EAL domain-containing protein [Synechocystis sp. CS-94]
MSTILIVEDEAIIRELIGETLSLENYDVLEAENGVMALGLLDSLPVMPDLIICDIMMPEMDGHGLIEALQHNPKTAAIPFIFLTALGTMQDFRKGMNSGADDYLIKPFKQEDLLTAVNSRLQKKAKLSAFYQSETPGLSTERRRRSHRSGTPTLTPEEGEIWRELEEGLNAGQVYLYYQPKVAIHNHCLVGCEALIRWHHPRKGFVSPGIFIPIAEKTGFISVVGQWVIEAALNQCQQWQCLGLNPIQVAINISADQFHGEDLIGILRAGVRKYHIDPQQLEVELTETLLVKNVQDSIEQLNVLRAEGFSVAIDDFGTGYSSLSYLQQFPFDVLKIDQSFVRHIDQNAKNKTITASIINLAHELDLRVVAEGVETWAEYDTIADMSCDELQGYLFSRPLPVADFTELLSRGTDSPILPLRHP